MLKHSLFHGPSAFSMLAGLALVGCADGSVLSQPDGADAPETVADHAETDTQPPHDDRSDSPTRGQGHGSGASEPDTDLPPPSGCRLPDGALSFEQVKGPTDKLPTACAPQWTEQQLERGFAAIRDTRWLYTPRRPDFPRRIPWLAAEIGCEERALGAQFYLQQAGYPRPYFIRVKKKEGAPQLSLVTENDPEGMVSWSGHVAPVVRVNEQLAVLDPALNPYRPLTVLEWLDSFSTEEGRDVALCRDRQTDVGCFDATPRELDSASVSDSLQVRLEEEWRVQELIGRDPYRALGDCPPWSTCPVPEPLADPDQAPSIRYIAADQFDNPICIPPIYIVGDNFIPGLTTVHVVGDGIDELTEITDCNLRRIRLDTEYPPGTYQVTAANGDYTSPPALLKIVP